MAIKVSYRNTKMCIVSSGDFFKYQTLKPGQTPFARRIEQESNSEFHKPTHTTYMLIQDKVILRLFMTKYLNI